MLTIFDIDGTLCDTQEVEGRCYAEALSQSTGISLETLDWTHYPEPTSSGIVRGLLADDPQIEAKEREFQALFVSLLEQERPRFPGDFSPIAGAVEFIRRLQSENICTVAIASGCYDTEAEFKLACCGLSLHDFPHATSSDIPHRREILSLAASRAGFDPSTAIYFGDAPWDVTASKALGIPMIGIGRRIDQLRELGVADTFRDFTDTTAIIEAMRRNHLSTTFP